MIKNLFFLFLLGKISLFAIELEMISKTEGVLSSECLSHFKTLFGLDTFIETGTYAGDTTFVASKIFNEVHTIEIWEPLYRRAQNRFAQEPHVHLYWGDTTTQLAQTIDHSSAKRLYWLDAHSSGDGTGGIPGFSPILIELDQILNEKNDLDSVILIDDLRGMCHCDGRTNLPLRMILQKIKEISPDLQLYSLGDMGIIFNAQKYPFFSVSEMVKKSTVSRFFDPACEDEKELENLIDAESFLAQCDENTLEGKIFCELSHWVNRENLGGEVIYLLWQALRELEKKQYVQAIASLELVANSFYSHWRVDAYLVRALILNQELEKARTLFHQKLTKIHTKHPQIIEKIIPLQTLNPL